MRLLTDPLDNDETPDDDVFYKPTKQCKPDRPSVENDPNLYYIGKSISDFFTDDGTSKSLLPELFDGIQVTPIDENVYRVNLLTKKGAGRYVDTSWICTNINPKIPPANAEYLFEPPLDEPRERSKKFMHD